MNIKEATKILGISIRRLQAILHEEKHNKINNIHFECRFPNATQDHKGVWELTEEDVMNEAKRRGVI